MTVQTPFDPRFDTPIDRRGTNCDKWDNMQRLHGVAPGDGIAMWVADTDFAPPAIVQAAAERMVRHGVYGYYGNDAGLREAIAWWMHTRHGWEVAPDAIFHTHGLVNGIAHVIDAFTEPGDGVVIFPPVYHAFARIIRAGGRDLVDCPLVQRDGRGTMDFAAYDAAMTGRERMAILCSPHNPGGQVWTPEELRAVADFAIRHDLILIADEIHHDLVYPGHTHLTMARAAPDILDRLVVLSAVSKTFNLAGGAIGQVVVPDPKLQARFAARLKAFGLTRNAFGMTLAEAAYSPEGAAWVDDLMAYLDRNRRIFDDGMAAIPGVTSRPLQATFLAWVDFTGTGMGQAEIERRIAQDARIAASSGPGFGAGGNGFMRFNLGLPRARIIEAVARLQDAFSDLQ